MTAEQILSVSAAVLTLVQLTKWAQLPDRYGPFAVIAWSIIGVVGWAWTHDALTKANAWDLFLMSIAVATSAAGFYGFSRASAAALVKALPPPGSGAGSEPTTKEPT